MNILDLLDRPIAYHRVFVTLTKSVKAAVLLSQAVYWQKRANQADGWWYKTAEEWQEETGLTKHEQDTARRDCEPYLTSDLRGVPATLYWKIDEEKLTNALIQFSGKRKTRNAESAKQVTRKAQNINKNTETTTETTTDIKAAKPKKEPVPPEILVYREVTHLYPLKVNWDSVVKIVQSVSDRIGRTATAEDLRPFFEAWTFRGFKPTNINWTSWAVSGVIPQHKQNQQKPEPKAFQGIRDYINSIIPEDVVDGFAG